MAATSLRVDRSPEAVFAVLADPWRFAHWVVGAQRIRDVDREWPAVGSRFHHRVGFGPFTLDDSTVLEEIDPPRRMVLRARARPTGIARVTLDLVATRDGGTEIHMEEHPTSGPARYIPGVVLDGLITARNRKSLRRLAELAGSPA